MSDYWTMKMIKEGYGLPPLTSQNIRENGDKRGIMFGYKKLETKINCLTKEIDDLVIRLNHIDRIVKHGVCSDKITHYCQFIGGHFNYKYITYIYENGHEYMIDDLWLPNNATILKSENENNVYAVYVVNDRRKKYVIDLVKGNAILLSDEYISYNKDED